MANSSDVVLVVQATLRDWLIGPGEAQWGFGLAAGGGVAAEWSALGRPPRRYPAAAVVNAKYEVEACAPYVLDEATGVAPGSLALCFGELTATLQFDVWCNQLAQRRGIETALVRALHSDPRRAGLHLAPVNYWSVPISYTLRSIQQQDTEEAAGRSECRLMALLEVSTLVVAEVPATGPLAANLVAVVSLDSGAAESSSAAFPLGPPQ
jgi:hypothetical protein